MNTMKGLWCKVNQCATSYWGFSTFSNN